MVQNTKYVKDKTIIPISINAVMFERLERVVPDFKKHLESGQLKCNICNQPLSEVGIYSVERRGNNLIWCCQSLDCVTNLNLDSNPTVQQ